MIGHELVHAFQFDITTNANARAGQNLDLGHVYEPSDEASTPLAADADYGWPVEQTAVEQPELAHTNGR